MGKALQHIFWQRQVQAGRPAEMITFYIRGIQFQFPPGIFNDRRQIRLITGKTSDRRDG